jgi:uncharacterized protein
MDSDKKGFSRRDFLRAAGTAGTASVLAAAGAFAQISANDAESAKTAGSTVPTRPFGKTGIQVPILSLGGMFDIPSNQLMLRQAVKWGVTFWDTADCYEGGNSEIGFGQFFKRQPEIRKEIFLVTKSDARDPDGMTKLLNRSLERMNTDYIDLYFIHGMRRIDEIDDRTKAWVEQAKSEGKIKLFGFSTHNNMEELMLQAAKLGWIDGITMSYNFRLMRSDKMKAAVAACADAGIGLSAMKTQGGGSVRTDSDIELEMAGRFVQLGFTDPQARLKAVWECPEIASICSQMPNMSILMSNIAAAMNQTKLSADDLQLMERYAQETSNSYCTGCTRICEPCVDGAAPIGDIMRYLMYYHSYGDHTRARTLFAEIPRGTRERLLSIDYASAEQYCPQKLHIGRLIEEATVLLA